MRCNLRIHLSIVSLLAQLSICIVLFVCEATCRDNPLSDQKTNTKFFDSTPTGTSIQHLGVPTVSHSLNTRQNQVLDMTSTNKCTRTHEEEEAEAAAEPPTKISPREDEIRSILLQEANYDIHDPTKTQKRQEYLGWDQYFMSLSLLSAQRSKDPNVQTGACIVDSKNRIVGIGYNGFPRGCSDDYLPWASSHDLLSNGGAHSQEVNDVGNATVNILHTRDAYMCRAEVNAILNKCSDNLEESRMYVPELPCKLQADVTSLENSQELILLLLKLSQVMSLPKSSFKQVLLR